jgi:hypothetical protein
MKVVLGKRSLSKKRNPGNHKMPIDFIDQLSKFEKEPTGHQKAVCHCGYWRVYQ